MVNYEALQNYSSSWNSLLYLLHDISSELIIDPLWLTPEILPWRFTSLIWPLSCLPFFELGHIHGCLWILAVTQINCIHLITVCYDPTLDILGSYPAVLTASYPMVASPFYTSHLTVTIAWPQPSLGQTIGGHTFIRWFFWILAWHSDVMIIFTPDCHTTEIPVYP